MLSPRWVGSQAVFPDQRVLWLDFRVSRGHRQGPIVEQAVLGNQLGLQVVPLSWTGP